MTVPTVPPPTAPEQADDGIRRRRWTREEYYRAAKLGLFRPEERLELLDGEILEKMSPQLTPHATAVSDSAHQLGTAFGTGYYVRVQQPLILDDRSEPEPDLVVVPGAPRDYLVSHPRARDAALVVEISDTTLRLDRGRKLAAYAGAGIPEYWIENLKDRRLEVYRDPSGSRYRTRRILGEEETISPLHSPCATIRVADLLPPEGTAGDETTGRQGDK